MADDIIASARSMTVASDGQYNTLGLPKAGLTPATITAMVGMSKGWGSGLDAHASVAGAVSNLSGINSLDPRYAKAQELMTKVTAQKEKLMSGGPAIFMQKFNAVKAHINDSIELRKVTDFTANSSFSTFGKGVTSMDSLATGGIDGACGNMKSIGKAVSAMGRLVDPTNMDTFGKPAGFLGQLSKNKMLNATGLSKNLADAGISPADFNNPDMQDKINSVMGKMSNPAMLNAVKEQMEVNPFKGLPGVSGASSITENKAGQLLGGSSQATTPPAEVPAAAAPSTPTTPEPAKNPVIWGSKNDETSFGKATNPVKTNIEKIDEQLQALSTEFTHNYSTPFTDAVTAFINAQYALEFGKAGVIAERNELGAKYKPIIEPLYHGAFDKANEIGRLANTLPRGSDEYIKWATLRNNNIESILKIMDAQMANLVDVKKDVISKINAAGGS